MINFQKGIPIKDGDSFILDTNPFRFLYLAAESLIKDAEQAVTKNERQIEVNHSIGVIVVLLLSTEALINRVYECFLRSKFPRQIYEEIMGKWSLTMKWYFAPLIYKSGGNNKTFDVKKEPWQSFSELKKIRDYFAHPKPAQFPFTVLDAKKKILDVNEGVIPRWPQTTIPKDLNHFRWNDAQTVLEIINKMIDKLDSFMGGTIKKDDWYLTEQMSKYKKADE